MLLGIHMLDFGFQRMALWLRDMENTLNNRIKVPSALLNGWMMDECITGWMYKRTVQNDSFWCPKAFFICWYFYFVCTFSQYAERYFLKKTINESSSTLFLLHFNDSKWNYLSIPCKKTKNLYSYSIWFDLSNLIFF